ncbi:hypothetical protein CDL15_Pgr004875 [Punica granatum]|uniref:Protein SENESCENCE-ASSOCIATED GENE 21, mitochondrial-like n=1 Tax=Punica granatum TaxID=22663 RepID=A0A218W768_PUNGR|nr:hypothetical protein CDL15_Pgr004875 [Punica granatum]PKI50419.1 hypothetical protein CRG98_029169 [Punica granatum]
MARVVLNTLLLLSQRSYGTVAVQPVAVSRVTRTAESYLKREEEKMHQKVIWMKDPKTGNWIPEDHIGTEVVDVVDLREKLLPRKHSEKPSSI